MTRWRAYGSPKESGAELRVLLTEVQDEHVQALLCDHECDWATETDAVLAPITTGLPHRLLVPGDISASILTYRLSRAVGRIEPHLVARISCVVASARELGLAIYKLGSREG